MNPRSHLTVKMTVTRLLPHSTVNKHTVSLKPPIKKNWFCTYLVAIRGHVMLGEAQASGLQGAHSYSLSSRPETAPKTLRHPPVHPPPIPNPLPAPREVLALLPAPSSLLSLLARPFCGQNKLIHKHMAVNACWEVDRAGNRDPARFSRMLSEMSFFGDTKIRESGRPASYHGR